MVTKVGSAGQVVESVIQYQQNAQANRPGVAADYAPEKKEEAEDRRPQIVSLAPNRPRKSSDLAGEIKTRNAQINSGASVQVPTPMPVPVSEAVVMENADGEIIETRPSLELSREAVEITVNDVNKRLAHQGAAVEFSYHEKTGRYSFKVMDSITGEVLREVPPQKSLDMVAKMFELAGLIIDEKR